MTITIDDLKKAIGWFNGKKTVIAAAVFILSAFFDQVIVAQWDITAAWIPKFTGTLDWFGMVLGGFGLTHKGIKVIEAKKTGEFVGEQ